MEFFFGKSTKLVNCDEQNLDFRKNTHYDYVELRDGEIVSGVAYSTNQSLISDVSFYRNHLRPS